MAPTLLKLNKFESEAKLLNLSGTERNTLNTISESNEFRKLRSLQFRGLQFR
jgi:hypothetical protein